MINEDESKNCREMEIYPKMIDHIYNDASQDDKSKNPNEINFEPTYIDFLSNDIIPNNNNTEVQQDTEIESLLLDFISNDIKPLESSNSNNDKDIYPALDNTATATITSSTTNVNVNVNSAVNDIFNFERDIFNETTSDYNDVRKLNCGEGGYRYIVPNNSAVSLSGLLSNNVSNSADFDLDFLTPDNNDRQNTTNTTTASSTTTGVDVAGVNSTVDDYHHHLLQQQLLPQPIPNSSNININTDSTANPTANSTTVTGTPVVSSSVSSVTTTTTSTVIDRHPLDSISTSSVCVPSSSLRQSTSSTSEITTTGTGTGISPMLSLNVRKTPLISQSGTGTTTTATSASNTNTSTGTTARLSLKSSKELQRETSSKYPFPPNPPPLAGTSNVSTTSTKTNANANANKNGGSGSGGSGNPTPPPTLISSIGKGLWGAIWGPLPVQVPLNKSQSQLSQQSQSSFSAKINSSSSRSFDNDSDNVNHYNMPELTDRYNNSNSTENLSGRSTTTTTGLLGGGSGNGGGGSSLSLPTGGRVRSKSTVGEIIQKTAEMLVGKDRDKDKEGEGIMGGSRSRSGSRAGGGDSSSGGGGGILKRTFSFSKSKDEEQSNGPESQKLLTESLEENERDQLDRSGVDHESYILNDLDWLRTESERMGREQDLTPPVMESGKKSRIVHPQIAAQLVLKLPQILQYDTWLLLYSVLDNGADLTSFFAKTDCHQYSLIIVETDNGDVFGGFADSEWNVSQSFYGGGQCFLFRVAFKWTGMNDLFMWSNFENVAMGGGGGFGFVLDRDFVTGSTGTCETFANPPLVNSNIGTFHVKNVEVWGFSSGIIKNKCPKSLAKTSYLKDSRIR
eukprot:gene3574-7106_t